MIATIVHIWVKPEHRDAFIAATTINHQNSIQEVGNLRFDFIEDAANPNKFVLYEAYESAEAAAAHKTTEHYLTWRKTVADWMVQPRQGVKHNIIAPMDKNLW